MQIDFKINSFIPKSDQHLPVISPYNIGTLWSRQVMRIKKLINYSEEYRE